MPKQSEQRSKQRKAGNKKKTRGDEAGWVVQKPNAGASCQCRRQDVDTRSGNGRYRGSTVLINVVTRQPGPEALANPCPDCRRNHFGCRGAIEKCEGGA